MRVAMYYNNHDVRVEEIPAPAIGPGEMQTQYDSCVLANVADAGGGVAAGGRESNT